MDNLADCEVEELGHTSEIGLRVRTPTLADLFCCLAKAMIALTGAKPEPEADPVFFEVDLSAVDLESLLVDWLNEILYLHEVAGIVPDTIDADVRTPHTIEATVLGRRAHGAPDLQIKAVTYHQLQIGQDGEEWKAEVFFDI